MQLAPRLIGTALATVFAVLRAAGRRLELAQRDRGRSDAPTPLPARILHTA